jgi:subtilisin-like proprotein convertase family protein
VNAEGNIHGGEWIGYSQTSHPDFLWLPVVARGGNPNIDMSNVKMLLEKSRQIDIGGGTSTDGEIVSFENTFEFDIPDNDTNGATSTIEVHDSHTIGRLEVEVNIEHTYIGDLKVTLKKGDKERVLHDESGGSSDNIKKTYNVNAFNGMDALGTWELHVTDSANADVGKIKSWKLKVNTSTTAGSDEGNFAANSTGSVEIPDDTPDGGVSTINVDANHTIRRMTVTVDIEHSYIGALVVELKHGAVKKVLHNMAGGSDTSITKTFELDDFNGDQTAGAWELIVVDTDAYDDSGQIKSWKIEFTY